MNPSEWTKRQVRVVLSLHALFMVLVIGGLASGLVWRLPHILQAILLFAAGVDVAVWARFLRDRRKTA